MKIRIQAAVVALFAASVAQAQQVTMWGPSAAADCAQDGWSGDWCGLIGPVPPMSAPVISLSAGGATTAAALSNGTVVVWGPNFFGETAIPSGLPPIVRVSVGGLGTIAHVMALGADGRVYCWGRSFEGQCRTPADLSGVEAVAGGGNHSVALTAGGVVRCWGANGSGQCSVPADLPSVMAISAGWRSTAALCGDGTVRCWGSNDFGERSVPTGLVGVVSIGSGDTHVAAVREDGTVVCWGSNAVGQCDVPAALTGAVQVSGGWGHTDTLVYDGSVVQWGSNMYSQRRNTPVGSARATAIEAGYFHTVALSPDCNNDGIVDYGQCRDGSLPDYNGNNTPDCCENGQPCEVGRYPVQWRSEDGGNGHWYLGEIHPEGIDWPSARQASEDRGGHLATLTNSMENELAFRLLPAFESWPNSYGPWIGGYRIPGAWAWVTGEPFSWTNWRTGEPNNDSCSNLSEDAIHMNALSSGWNDFPPVPTGCDIARNGTAVWSHIVEWSADCNGDGIVDKGQILLGQLPDTNDNGIPDPCEVPTCRDADIYRDFNVNGADLGILLSQWGPNTPLTESDLNKDGAVDGLDLGLLLSFWGPCPI